MAGNSIGHVLKLTSFGESHGAALGGVLDGYPSGIWIDQDLILAEMARRRPGSSRFSTQRQEADKTEILSGVFEGRSTGTPIGFIIRNSDQHSKDYDALKDVYRPSHADYAYHQRYSIVDHRGGGRSSGRESAVRVMAGALAKMYLREKGITVNAGIRCIGSVRDTGTVFNTGTPGPVPALDPTFIPAFEAEIDKARMALDSVGGVVECRIGNVPAGLGDPVYDKLSADLAKAMFSIGAVKGFEIGDGFSLAGMLGSQANDQMEMDGARPSFITNHSGGIQGGLSNGEQIILRVAFKPTPSISQVQHTVNASGQDTELVIKGRHDPCIVPRAVVVVEAMAALTIADHLLMRDGYGKA